MKQSFKNVIIKTFIKSKGGDAVRVSDKVKDSKGHFVQHCHANTQTHAHTGPTAVPDHKVVGI